MVKVLIISDIHGNADALKTLLESVGGWDYVFVLGDLVDYGPEPHVVVDLIKGLRPDVVLMGNHDYAVAFNTDCRCAPELHELSEYTRVNISYRLLSKEQIDWLKSLPITRNLTIDNVRIYLTHGSPRNPLYGYLKPSLPESEILLALTPNMYAVRPQPVDTDLIVVGHTHIPMDLRIRGMRVLNPGSVGQPRDGDYRTSAAILDLRSGEFRLYRNHYDVEGVIKKLRSLGLDLKYLTWLERILINGRV
jgi:protein phosphatase